MDLRALRANSAIGTDAISKLSFNLGHSNGLALALVSRERVVMSEQAVQSGQPPKSEAVSASTRSMLGRFAEQFSDAPNSFDIILPDASVQRFGPGGPSFTFTINNKQGLRALASIDEGRIGDAYVAGDIEIEGDMLQPFQLRGQMKDMHPIAAFRSGQCRNCGWSWNRVPQTFRHLYCADRGNSYQPYYG